MRKSGGQTYYLVFLICTEAWELDVIIKFLIIFKFLLSRDLINKNKLLKGQKSLSK